MVGDGGPLVRRQGRRRLAVRDLLVRMLVDGVAKGSNLLLNVGPNGRGVIDPRAERALLSIGEWIRLHGRAVYGCGPSDFQAPRDCHYTQRGDRLYLHLFAWPHHEVHLPGLAGRVQYAQFLHDASEVRAVSHRDPGQSGRARREPKGRPTRDTDTHTSHAASGCGRPGRGAVSRALSLTLRRVANRGQSSNAPGLPLSTTNDASVYASASGLLTVVTIRRSVRHWPRSTWHRTYPRLSPSK